MQRLSIFTQVHEVFVNIGKAANLTCVCVYGGSPYETQEQVGTPHVIWHACATLVANARACSVTARPASYAHHHVTTPCALCQYQNGLCCRALPGVSRA